MFIKKMSLNYLIVCQEHLNTHTSYKDNTSKIMHRFTHWKVNILFLKVTYKINARNCIPTLFYKADRSQHQ